MKFSNITDQDFWDSKYARAKPRYRLWDPFYGKGGLLDKTLSPWLDGIEDVLELGCGSSRFLMYFNMVAGLETFGLDFSAQGIAGLKAMAKPHNVNHQLFFGDMFEQDLDGRKFDLVFHSGLVEHFEDLSKVFQRSAFFCRDGGLMIFIIPNMQNLAWSWHRSISPDNYQGHIRYTKDDMMEALGAHFELLYSRSWGFPQIFAGGPPESGAGYLLKYLNMGLMLWISYTVPKYRGKVGERLASSRIFVCRKT